MWRDCEWKKQGGCAMTKKKAKKKADGPKKPIYTGSALESGIIFSKLIGDVMYYSVAVRAKDGEISTTSKAVKKPESRISKIAPVRLVQKLFPVRPDTGFKLAVMKALKEGGGKFGGNSGGNSNEEITLPDKKASQNVVVAIISKCVGLAIFAFLPLPISHFLPVQNLHALGIIESLVGSALILTFMLGTFKLLNIGNHFAHFHGAEHKVIQCFNAGQPLTLENVKKFTRDDVQCGTNFLGALYITTALIGTLVFSFVGIENVLLRAAVRALTLPAAQLLAMGIFMSGIRHEHRVSKALVKIVSVPGLWLQRVFSTKEPEDEQLEVAIAGFNALLAMDEEK